MSATDNEVQMLDHIDALTAVMTAALDAGDTDTLHDALTESLLVERRLAASRENTWVVWWAALTERRAA